MQSRRNAICTSRKQSPINGATRLRAVFATFETVVLSIIVIVIAVELLVRGIRVGAAGPINHIRCGAFGTYS